MRILILHNALQPSSRDIINVLTLKQEFENIEKEKVRITLWGPGYENYKTIPFEEIIKRNDVLLIICQQSLDWISPNLLSNLRILKIIWITNNTQYLHQYFNLLRLCNFNFIYYSDIALDDLSINKRIYSIKTNDVKLVPPCKDKLIYNKKSKHSLNIGCLGDDNTLNELELTNKDISKHINIIKQSDIDTHTKLVKTISKYKIFLNPNNSTSFYNNIPTIVGCKTLYICAYSYKLEQLFNTTTEIIAYHDNNDLSEKLSYYLNIERARNSAIESAVTTLTSNYSYKKRCESIINDIKSTFITG